MLFDQGDTMASVSRDKPQREGSWPTIVRVLLLVALPFVGLQLLPFILIISGALGLISAYGRGGRPIQFGFDIVFSVFLVLAGVAIIVPPVFGSIPPITALVYYLLTIGVMVLFAGGGVAYLLAGIAILLFGLAPLIHAARIIPLPVALIMMVAVAMLGLAMLLMALGSSRVASRGDSPPLSLVGWALAILVCVGAYVWLVDLADRSELGAKLGLLVVLVVPLLLVARAFMGQGAHAVVSGPVYGGVFYGTATVHEAQEGIGGAPGWLFGALLAAVGFGTMAYTIW